MTETQISAVTAIVYCIVFAILSLISCIIILKAIQSLYCSQYLCYPTNNTQHSTNNDNNSPSTSPRNTTEDLNIYIRHSTAIGIISYLLTVFISLTMTIMVVINTEKRNHWHYLSLFGIIAYFIGRWTKLLLFVFRLDYTFRDSIFQYSSYLIRALHFILIILIILVLIIIFGGFAEIISDNIAISIRYICIALWMLIEFIFSTFIITLFLKKLFSLFMQRMKRSKSLSLHSRSGSISRSPSINSVNMTDLQITNELSNGSESVRIEIEETVNPQTLSAMTRYTLLVMISIITSILSMILSLWLNYAYFIFIIAGIDAFLNGLCIYLFNTFAASTYRLICKYPDQCCKKCCIYCIVYVYQCNINESDQDIQ